MNEEDKEMFIIALMSVGVLMLALAGIGMVGLGLSYLAKVLGV